MKIKDANGVEGLLLNPYHTDGVWVFRVTNADGTFTVVGKTGVRTQ